MPTPAIVQLVIEALAGLLFFGFVASIWLLFKGSRELRRLRRDAAHPNLDVLLKSPLVPSVSVIAVVPQGDPAQIVFVRRLLGLTFGNREVVVVLNGASARAIETWCEEFHLFRSFRLAGEPLATGPVHGVYESRDPIQLVVIEKEAGTTADARNAGVNATSAPFIAVFDSEGEFDAEALLRLIVPVLQAPDETLAVCGASPSASAETLAGRLGEIESLRGWLGRSLAWAPANAVLPAPGQAVVIGRQALIQAGGWMAGPLEMFVQIHAGALRGKSRYRIVFLPDPLCRPRRVETMDELRRSVFRSQQWLSGALSRLGSIRDGWAAAGAGRILGLLWARFLRPLCETAVYLLAIAGLAMGWVDVWLVLLVLLVTIGGGILTSLTAIVLRALTDYQAEASPDLGGLFVAAIAENFGYRQLRNLWLIAGFVQGRFLPRSNSDV
jgi:cellulose synthase/poly-beta-1,6-N-acetylglucosamine synthase-like glycosyltransferase